MEKNIIIHSDGRLFWNGKEYKCALGRGGVCEDKKEGDGATPAGCFEMREVFYRADRVPKPETKIPIRALSENDGWCDAPDDENYNKHVMLPYNASAEKLWREDHVYDIIVVLGYNDDPALPGKGSAIFMHIARETYTPTDGCPVVSLPDLLEILSSVEPDARVCISK